jgi:hypothetical protein
LEGAIAASFSRCWLEGLERLQEATGRARAVVADAEKMKGGGGCHTGVYRLNRGSFLIASTSLKVELGWVHLSVKEKWRRRFSGKPSITAFIDEGIKPLRIPYISILELCQDSERIGRS